MSCAANGLPNMNNFADNARPVDKVLVVQKLSPQLLGALKKVLDLMVIP